jgi:hypothetical protein
MYFYIAYGWFNMAETCSRVRVLINDGRVKGSIIGVYIYTYLTVYASVSLFLAHLFRAN